jgi:hypothetical protein
MQQDIIYLQRLKKMKQVTLKVKNCSANQWQTLLLELYGVKQNWKRYGPQIKLQAASIERIIRTGTSNKPQATSFKRRPGRTWS